MNAAIAQALIFAVFLLVFSGILARYWSLNVRKQDARIQEALSSLKPEIDRKPGLFGVSSTWRISNKDGGYFVKYFPSQQRAERCFEIWVVSSLPFQFSITNNRRPNRLAQRTGFHKLEIGDPFFDEKLRVQTNRPSDLRAFLLQTENRDLIRDSFQPMLSELSSDGSRIYTRFHADLLGSTRPLDLAAFEKTGCDLRQLDRRLHSQESSALV